MITRQGLVWVQVPGRFQACFPLVSLCPRLELRRAGAPEHKTPARLPEQHVHPLSERYQHPQQRQEH